MKLRVDRLGRWTMFLAVRCLVRVFRFDSLRRVGSFFGDWQYLVHRGGRSRRLADMAAALGCAARDARVARMLRSAYRVNTISTLEVASMIDRRIDTALMYRRCRVDGIDNLAAARSGRGAILLATHSGNSLLLLAQLADQGWPVTVVYRRTPSVPRKLLEDGLAHYGFEGIPANQGFRAYAGMVKALQQDRIVFAMMDDAVKKAESGVPARFLGKDMPIAGGIVQLARQTRAPIVPVLSMAVDPVWHFRIEPRLQLLSGGTIEEDVATVLRHIETQILAHPELWSWPHRRWRKFERQDKSGRISRSHPPSAGS